MRRFALLAMMTVCGMAWSQGQPPEGPAEASPPPVIDDRPPPGELVERLHARLEQIDAMRARIAGAIERIEAGEPPAEALGPGEMRMLFRRGRDDLPAFGGGPDGPGDTPGRRGEGAGGRPGMMDGPRHGPMGADAPTLDEARAFIKAHLPELAGRLKEAAERDPKRAERMIRRMMPRIAEMIRREKDDPEYVRLRVEEMRVGMRIIERMRALRGMVEQGADPEAIEAAKREIRELLGRQFDLRDKLDEHRLERMRRDYERGKARLAQRRADRDRMLDEHMQRVLERLNRRGGKGGPGHD